MDSASAFSSSISIAESRHTYEEKSSNIQHIVDMRVSWCYYSATMERWYDQVPFAPEIKQVKKPLIGAAVTGAVLTGINELSGLNNPAIREASAVSIAIPAVALFHAYGPVGLEYLGQIIERLRKRSSNTKDIQ